MDLCKVCGIKHEGSHCGADSCRACCAFFRRTISETRVYKCRKNNKCQITHDLRNSCRACRLQKCFEIGMVCPKSDEYVIQVASLSKKNSTTNDQDQSITTTTTPRSLSESSSYSTLQHLLNGIRKFMDSQRCLANIEKTCAEINSNEFIYIKKSKYDLLEKGCIALVYSMLNEYFEPFIWLTHEKKIELMKSFLLKFTILIKSYRSATNFPAENDTRLMTHPGYIVDLKNVDYFFLDKNNPKGIWPCMLEGMKLLLLLKYKFVREEINEIDISALAYVVFSLESEKLGIKIEAMERIKNSIFKELLSYYVNNLGFDQGAVKYSNLLNLIHDINDIKNWFHECYTAAKIFDPDLLYVWEDCCRF